MTSLLLSLQFLLLGGNDADVAAILTAFVEFHHSVHEGVERMVFAHSNILTGIVGSTTLANNDVTGDALLTTKNLHA